FAIAKQRWQYLWTPGHTHKWGEILQCIVKLAGTWEEDPLNGCQTNGVSRSYPGGIDVNPEVGIELHHSYARNKVAAAIVLLHHGSGKLIPHPVIKGEVGCHLPGVLHVHIVGIPAPGAEGLVRATGT